MVQQNNTSESIKKSQNTTSQKLLLAKNYLSSRNWNLKDIEVM